MSLSKRCLALAVLTGSATTAVFASSAFNCTILPGGSGIFEEAVTAINSRGDVIGVEDSYEHGAEGMFMRLADGTYVYLNSPDGGNLQPIGINDSGQVAAYTLFFNYETEEYTLGDTYILNADGSSVTIDPPSSPEYLNYSYTGFNNAGELAGTIYSSSGIPGSPNNSWLVFLRDAAGVFHILDKVSVDTPPTVSGLDDQGTMVEQIPNTNGYLLTATGQKTPLLFPGVPFNSPPGGNLNNTQTIRTGRNNLGWTVGELNAVLGPSQYQSAGFIQKGAHFVAVVCPENLTPSVSPGAINDSGVVAGSIYEQLPYGPGFGGLIATPTGVNPTATLSRDNWTFGIHAIGEASGLGTISVTNAGPADLHVPVVYVGTTGATTDHPESFQITHNTCSPAPNNFQQTSMPIIPPGGACQVEFQFTPQYSRWQTAGLYFLSDAPDSPGVVTIGGTGVGSVLRLSNSSWQFATHPVGQTSGSGKIYLYDEGPGPVNLSNISIGGTNAADFHLLGTTCAASLSGYHTCSVTFDFKPTAAGERTGTLDLNDNSEHGPLVIPIKGFGK